MATTHRASTHGRAAWNGILMTSQTSSIAARGVYVYLVGRENLLAGPTAAESGIKSDHVFERRGACRDQGDPVTLRLHVGDQQLVLSGQARVIIDLDKVQRTKRCGRGALARLLDLLIMIKRPQGISDLLESLKHSFAIIAHGRTIGIDGSPMLETQASAVDEGGGERGT